MSSGLRRGSYRRRSDSGSSFFFLQSSVARPIRRACPPVSCKSHVWVACHSSKMGAIMTTIFQEAPPVCRSAGRLGSRGAVTGIAFRDPAVVYSRECCYDSRYSNHLGGGLLMLRNPDAQIGVWGTRRARISTQSTTCCLLSTRQINSDDMISIDIIVSEMALFADGGLPGPSLASVEKQIGTVGTRVALLRLLGWLKARARTNVIRPLSLKVELEWPGNLRRIVSGVDSLDKLFDLNGDCLEISDQLTEADKAELLSCVDKSYRQRLIT